MNGERIGRFMLREVLGRGAQAVVWLAHDERLERDVALKLLSPGATSDAVAQWLQEARAVGRLSHPNIVPVFEADAIDDRAYLVFELVRGQTLAEALRRGGAMSPRHAVELMLAVLEGLRTAHAEGIVHRDLKPSNILLDLNDRPRVMDFGIAARVNDAEAGRICGTPGYMSPEAARGETPAPSMDLFAAGMILAELLTGTRLLRERDPFVALRRVIDEDMRLPDSAEVDDALRSIVHRALAREPGQRFADVGSMIEALQGWLGAGETSTQAAAGDATLEFLLRRMRQRSDFPALSDAVLRIQRVASSESENLNSLAGEILKDVALTNKLLRLVNSAQFRHAGGGTISTVSRAIALVGFAGVRNQALSLVLLEHMQDKQHAAQLKERYLCALLAGQVASDMALATRESEEAYLGAMMHNLGRMLTEFYLPDDARAIRDEMRPHAARGTSAITAEQASMRVLGIGFQELGIGAAKAWGLPESLQRTMRAPEGEPPGRRVEQTAERLRWVARVANEVAESVLSTDPQMLETRLGQIEQRFGAALGLSTGELKKAVDGARLKLGEFTRATGLVLPRGSEAERLVKTLASVPVESAKLLDLSLPTLPGSSARIHVAPATNAQAGELLTAGIQDITNTLAEESFKLNEVLRMVLETMFRALAFRRIVLCLRDARAQTLTGRFGLGEQVEAFARQFCIPVGPHAQGTPDLLAAVCQKGADMQIVDAGAQNVVPRLPAWLRPQAAGLSFLLLPLTMKRAPFGLIYADCERGGGLPIGERELSLLRTLRNQAVMAFRAAG